MDSEWEMHLFICIFQFSFALTIFSLLFWKSFGFITSPCVLSHFLFVFNLQSPYFNISLCSDFQTPFTFFSLQIEIMEWTVRVTVTAQIA